MRVLKFGGTSLSHPHRLDVVARRVAELREIGPVVVVVSALGGVTDQLTEALEAAKRGEPTLGLIRRLRSLHLEDPEERLDGAAKRQLAEELELWLRELEALLDGIARLGEAPHGAVHRLLASGERLSAPRVAAWLRAAGLAASVVDGTSLVRADCDLAEPNPTPPRLDAAATRRSVLEGLGGLTRGEVPVVTGFIGSDSSGRTVTLGRGASDLSATTLAAALEADAVEIWSDTDGVLSADPRRVPSAFPLRQLSFAEASSLARYGAKVLHPETLEPVRKASLPVHLRSTFHPEAPGTVLTDTVLADTGRTNTGLTHAVPAEAGRADPVEGKRSETPASRAPAQAASSLRVEKLEARSAPSIPLASQALSVLERADVAPLALSYSHGRLELWLRRADAQTVSAELQRRLRPLGGAITREGAKTAVALLPGNSSATALVASLAASLANQGLKIEALFTDRAYGSGAFTDEPSGPELAVAVVDEAVADLALRTAHENLVAVLPAGSRYHSGIDQEIDMEVAACG